MTGVSAYTRSCSAQLEIQPYHRNSKVNTNVSFFKFKAESSSWAYHLVNVLRERSYRKARDCLNAAAKSITVPKQCRQGDIKGVPGYRVGMLDALNGLCRRRIVRENTQYKFRINGYVYGDLGCGGHWTEKRKRWYIKDYSGYCTNGRAYLGTVGVVGPDPDAGM